MQKFSKSSKGTQVPKQVKNPPGVYKQTASVAEHAHMSKQNEGHGDKAFHSSGAKMSLPAHHGVKS